MELSPPRHDKKLICKICECQVNCRTFNSHSNACKDRAEIRDKVLRYQSRISAHINKAYDLRNQLNTNFAIEKKKLGKTLLKKTDSTPEQSIQIRTATETNLDQIANQEDTSNGMYLAVDPEGSPMMRSGKKSKTACHVLEPLGFNSNDYEDETLRSLQVLKMIIQYGQNSLTNVNEANPDKINDFKVKNQVGLLYAEIKDKQISEYITEFLELIQKLIKYKGLLTKKQEDIARIEEELYSPGTSDVELLSPQLKSKISYNSQISHKSSKITSLDDGNINERVWKKPSLHLKDIKQTFSRMGSDRINSYREHRDRGSNTPDLPRKAQFTPKASAGLSRFAAKEFFKDFPSSEAPGSAGLKRADTRRRKGKIAGELLKDIEKIGQIKFRHEMATVGLEDSSSPEKVRFDVKEDKEHSQGDIEDDQEEEKEDNKLRRVFTFNVNKIAEKKNNLRECPEDKNDGYEGESEGKDGEAEEDEENLEEIIKEKKGKGHKRVGSWDNKPKKVNIKKLLEGHAKAEVLEFLEEGLFIQGPVKSSFSTMDHMNISKLLSQKRRKQTQEEALEEIEEEHESLSLFTIRGYYSDSEVNQVRKLELQTNQEMGIEDFDFIRMLGEGAYGKVYLVRKKATGDLYAMKIVDYADKENKNNKAKSLRTERDVYKLIQGDWVVKAYYTFNHQSYICFVQEYIIGGDLQHLLEQMGCFEEPVAKFYFAELLLAVESLHELGIVHRDLKPNNVMIDATGHIKLTDFGLSEVGLERLRMNASTIRSLLTRENSLIDNSPNREEAFEQITRTNSTYFQRAESFSQDGGNEGTLNSILRQDSDVDLTMLMSMSIRQNKPQTENFASNKNKPDEKTVFPFLATQEERSNWKKGENPMGISQMNQSMRRKEKRRIVGTPDYIAPEIIRGEDCNDKAIDLWSLGVILYEFMVGIPPFNDESIDKIFGNIVHMRMEWPEIGYEEDCLSPEAADLMKKLMNQNPKERIKIKDVKRHPFFKGFDWQSMKQMTVPIVPKKKEIDPDAALMDLSVIFKPNDGRLMKRNSIIQEITTFNTKRYDLLHQMNENLYKNHVLDNPDDFFELKNQQMRSSHPTLFS